MSKEFNRFLNLIARTRQVLNDLEKKQDNSIENLIEFERELQDMARVAHDEAFTLATGKPVNANEGKICTCNPGRIFHADNCPKRIKIGKY
jgi:hypothetical protein